MLLNDEQIRDLALNHGMITPFEERLITRTDGVAAMSFGLSSAGYDLRLSPDDFRVYRHLPGQIVNPKRFNPAHLEKVRLTYGEDGNYFILPGHTYGLGVAKERLNLPRGVMAICMGKSSYARIGVIPGVTPAEPGWEGHLTLEFSNSSDADVMLFADEGIVQMLFLTCEPCKVSYSDRSGKYQGQPEQVVLPRMFGQ